MTRKSKYMLGSAAAAALAYHVVIGFGTSPTGAAAAPEAVTAALPAPNAERNAYFGDLHHHTTNSFDAYVLMGTKTTPDDAFHFARGDTITYLGQPLRSPEPLDFLSVTDHAENMGVFNQLDDPKSAFSLSEIGKLAAEGGHENFFKIFKYMNDGANLPGAKEAGASTWARLIASANAANVPGRFTTFIGFEWTSMPGGQNLHRNIIFRGDKAPAPFTSADSTDPRALWKWLSTIRGQGYDALAIAHNGNASNGLMYDWTTVDGRPIDEAYAQLRAVNEPLSEVAQNKGTSETHPLLSANDEFAGFEIFDRMLAIGNPPSKASGSYWREALGRGLVIASKTGANPYKDGAVGSGDLHSGVPVSSESAFGGASGINLGAGKWTKKQATDILQGAPTAGGMSQLMQTSAGLAGVWAEENTRESLFAALRRKETFATSGTRIKLRFFGGWGFTPKLLTQSHWAKAAYAGGVPMGGDLPLAAKPGQVPTFAIEAVKDPQSGNLDRIQVVKVWLENGAQKERVFDVSWSGQRSIDATTGKLAPVGDTVDLKTGKYTNDIGAARLATLWRDPTFRAEQAAVYYVRVLEIPTPRWSTIRAIENGLPIPKNYPATIQERAWSSPIWYTPKVKG